jgi:hypothetical protein
MWTEIENQQLQELVLVSGLSAGAIAKKLDKTRSAVIGRCFRLKLALPNSGTRNYYVGQAILKEKKKREPKLKPKNTNINLKEAFLLRKQPDQPLAPLNLNLLDLKSGNCRFIFDDLKYCGLRTVHGTSWCEHHFKICVDRSPRKSRELSPSLF